MITNDINDNDASLQNKLPKKSMKKPQIRPELLSPEYETFVKDNELPTTVIGLKANDLHWKKQIRNYVGERCRHWPPIHTICGKSIFLTSGYYPDLVGTIQRKKVGMKFADAIITGQDDGFEDNAYQMLKDSRKSKANGKKSNAGKKKSRKSRKSKVGAEEDSESNSAGSNKSQVVTEEVTETYVIKRKKKKDGEAEESMTDLLKTAKPVKVDRKVSVGTSLISESSREAPKEPGSSGRKSMRKSIGGRKSIAGGRKSLRKQSVISLAGGEEDDDDEDDDDDDSDSDEDDDDDDEGGLSRRKSRKSVGGRKSTAGRKSIRKSRKSVK